VNYLHLRKGYSFRKLVRAFKDFIPGLNLYNLSNHFNQHLTEEEMEFHELLEKAEPEKEAGLLQFMHNFYKTWCKEKQRDSVGLVLFDQGIKKYIPPKSALRSHLHVILQELDKLEPSRTTNISSALHEMAKRIKRRGLIILISDLFDDPDKVINGLKHFRHKKHEVIVFHVLDPKERSFAFPELAIFKDMETDEELMTSPWQIRKEYTERFKALVNKYTLQCRESLIDYVLLDTSIPFDYALFSYLSKRQRLW